LDALGKNHVAGVLDRTREAKISVRIVQPRLVEHDVEDAHHGAPGAEPLDEIGMAPARPLVDVGADPELVRARPRKADDHDLRRGLDRPPGRKQPPETKGFLDVQHRGYHAQHQPEECYPGAERRDPPASRPVAESAWLDRY